MGFNSSVNKFDLLFGWWRLKVWMMTIKRLYDGFIRKIL